LISASVQVHSSRVRQMQEGGLFLKAGFPPSDKEFT
jgi:hypothetical protein